MSSDDIVFMLLTSYYKEFYNRILCLISVITLGLLIISDYESGHENNKKEG